MRLWTEAYSPAELAALAESWPEAVRDAHSRGGSLGECGDPWCAWCRRLCATPPGPGEDDHRHYEAEEYYDGLGCLLDGRTLAREWPSPPIDRRER